VNAGDSARTAKSLARIANADLGKMAPEIRAVNREYEKLHRIEEVMDRSLIKSGKSPAGLIGAGGENQTKAKLLRRLGEATDSDMLSQAENLAAMRHLYDPGVMSGQSTGKALLGLASGSVLGGAGGGQEGAGAGALLGLAASNPAAIRAAIRAGKYVPSVSLKPSPGAIGAFGGYLSPEIQRKIKALGE
jgi:hypothetical protein